MNDFVAIAQHICEVCGCKHDANEILIHKRMQKIKDEDRVTDWGRCPECEAKNKEGYIALVGAQKSAHGNTIKLSEADRTGDIIHMKREVFTRFFNCDPSHAELPMVFVTPDVIKFIKEKLNEQRTTD